MHGKAIGDKTEILSDLRWKQQLNSSDTQGLPGSPAIADAILTKIRSADVFIGDLTFIDGDLGTEPASDTRRTPNPNVMLEYGYALHALGDAKIIGVFNEACGSPQQLPFDLAHRRWPIRFNLPNGESANRQNEKQLLTRALKDAVRSIISQFEELEAPAAAPTPFVAAEPGDGVGRLRHAQDFLCIGSAGESKPVWLRQGPMHFCDLCRRKRCTNWAKSTPIKLRKHTFSQWEGCGAAIGEAADIKLDQSFIGPRRTTPKARGMHHNCS